MILLYGAGGEPGRGEIPMDPIRYAVSGDQFVCNRFGIELLREAIRECPIGPDSGFEAYPVYDYIEEHCRQYLTDVGDFLYPLEEEKFKSEPVAVAQGHGTLETLQLLFQAKELIDQYCVEEFGSPADFKDLKKVGLAYTTTEDDKHEIQAYANLIDHQTEVYLDGEIISLMWELKQFRGCVFSAHFLLRQWALSSTTA